MECSELIEGSSSGAEVGERELKAGAVKRESGGEREHPTQPNDANEQNGGFRKAH